MRWYEEQGGGGGLEVQRTSLNDFAFPQPLYHLPPSLSVSASMQYAATLDVTRSVRLDRSSERAI